MMIPEPHHPVIKILPFSQFPLAFIAVAARQRQAVAERYGRISTVTSSTSPHVQELRHQLIVSGQPYVALSLSQPVQLLPVTQLGTVVQHQRMDIPGRGIGDVPPGDHMARQIPILPVEAMSLEHLECFRLNTTLSTVPMKSSKPCFCFSR